MKKGARVDGRKTDELRPFKLKLGVNRYAEGSCLVSIGRTEVLCTASVEEKVPSFIEGSGKGWVTAEYAMLPRSCRSRVSRDISQGKISGRSHEIQRLIGRSLRAVVDFARLGPRTIWIDCDVLVGDGGTRCAAISGAYAALHQACRWLLKEGRVTELPVTDQVAAVSVGVVGGVPILDLSYTEDASAEVDMNVVMTGNGRFVELQGTAEREPFDDARLKRLIGLARGGIREILRAQRKAIGARRDPR